MSYQETPLPAQPAQNARTRRMVVATESSTGDDVSKISDRIEAMMVAELDTNDIALTNTKDWSSTVIARIEVQE